mmetsp:Transcript_76446/g.222012  ORF Transcript_76446/g.222012 Transcript_76446/m.222012 type:complete len:230 (+) Transcript_76446:62-751(+)
MQRRRRLLSAKFPALARHAPPMPTEASHWRDGSDLVALSAAAACAMREPTKPPVEPPLGRPRGERLRGRAAMVCTEVSTCVLRAAAAEPSANRTGHSASRRLAGTTCAGNQDVQIGSSACTCKPSVAYGVSFVASFATCVGVLEAVGGVVASFAPSVAHGETDARQGCSADDTPEPTRGNASTSCPSGSPNNASRLAALSCSTDSSDQRGFWPNIALTYMALSAERALR